VLFVSGYNSIGVFSALNDRRTLQKTFTAEALKIAIDLAKAKK
jgi:hypothetical protein